jgi:hypothetical protein
VNPEEARMVRFAQFAAQADRHGVQSPEHRFTGGRRTLLPSVERSAIFFTNSKNCVARMIESGMEEALIS